MPQIQFIPSAPRRSFSEEFGDAIKPFLFMKELAEGNRREQQQEQVQALNLRQLSLQNALLEQKVQLDDQYGADYARQKYDEGELALGTARLQQQAAGMDLATAGAKQREESFREPYYQEFAETEIETKRADKTFAQEKLEIQRRSIERQLKEDVAKNDLIAAMKTGNKEIIRQRGAELGWRPDQMRLAMQSPEMMEDLRSSIGSVITTRAKARGETVDSREIEKMTNLTHDELQDTASRLLVDMAEVQYRQNRIGDQYQATEARQMRALTISTIQDMNKLKPGRDKDALYEQLKIQTADDPKLRAVADAAYSGLDLNQQTLLNMKNAGASSEDLDRFVGENMFGVPKDKIDMMVIAPGGKGTTTWMKENKGIGPKTATMVEGMKETARKASTSPSTTPSYTIEDFNKIVGRLGQPGQATRVINGVNHIVVADQAEAEKLPKLPPNTRVLIEKTGDVLITE